MNIYWQINIIIFQRMLLFNIIIFQRIVNMIEFWNYIWNVTSVSIYLDL